MALNNSINIDGISLGVLRRSSAHKVAGFFEGRHHCEQLGGILLLVLFEFDLFWEASNHICECD
jgi:hypothetical protein